MIEAATSPSGSAAPSRSTTCPRSTSARLTRRAPLVGRAALTPGELRVARAVAGGLTNREVAAELVVSVRTVETHLASAYRKLAVHSRTQLALSLNDLPLASGAIARRSS